MREKKFYDRVKESLLLELTDGSFTPVADYLEKTKETNEGKIYYTSDKAAQAQYISMFEAQGIQVAVFDKALDPQFLSIVETYDDKVKYVRIDADVAGALKNDEAVAESKELTDLFIKVSGNEKLKVEFTALKDTTVPLLLTVSEESRRMEEMMKLYSMNGMGMGMSFPTESTLSINTACPLINKLEGMEEEKQEKAASYLYQLALLSQRKLSAEELHKFLATGYGILELL
jgi:molecular chaperone HtpG